MPKFHIIVESSDDDGRVLRCTFQGSYQTIDSIILSARMRTFMVEKDQEGRYEEDEDGSWKFTFK